MTDKEQQAAPTDAVSKILKILELLDEAVRRRVLAAVHAYYNLEASQSPQPPIQTSTVSADQTTPTTEQPQTSMTKDIRSLKEEKQPKTAIEMAAVMAYYLKELAPRKKEIVTSQDVETYFKQAGFHLPKNKRMTLTNAKNAGYFESVGEGQFKLNAVGYNLVAYSLPKTGSSGKSKARRNKSRAVQSKRRSKKSPARQTKKKSKK